MAEALTERDHKLLKLVDRDLGSLQARTVKAAIENAYLRGRLYGYREILSSKGIIPSKKE